MNKMSITKVKFDLETKLQSVIYDGYDDFNVSITEGWVSR